MNRLLFCFLFFVAVSARAQDTARGSLTVFSGEGEQFYLYMNGFRQNETPRQEVKVTGLDQLFCNVRIEFADRKLGSITRSRLAVSDGEDNLMNVRYRLTRVNNSIKLRFYSMNPLSSTASRQPASPEPPREVPVQVPGASLTVFSDSQDPFYLSVNGVRQHAQPVTRIRVEGLTALFCQVSIEFPDGKTPSIVRNSLPVSDGEDQLMDAEYRVSRSSSGARLRFFAMNQPGQRSDVPAGTWVSRYTAAGEAAPVPEPVKTEKDVPTVVSAAPIKEEKQPMIPVQEPKPVVANEKKPVLPDTVKNERPALKAKDQLEEPQNWTCQNEWPMWKTEYQKIRKEIETAKTDAEKLSVSVKLLNGNCLNTDQVIDLARLINGEQERRQFVEQAFSHTIDYKNYLRVLSLFQSSDQKRRLEGFLKSNR